MQSQTLFQLSDTQICLPCIRQLSSTPKMNEKLGHQILCQISKNTSGTASARIWWACFRQNIKIWGRGYSSTGKTHLGKRNAPKYRSSCINLWRPSTKHFGYCYELPPNLCYAPTQLSKNPEQYAYHSSTSVFTWFGHQCNMCGTHFRFVLDNWDITSYSKFVL